MVASDQKKGGCFEIQQPARVQYTFGTMIRCTVGGPPNNPFSWFTSDMLYYSPLPLNKIKDLDPKLGPYLGGGQGTVKVSPFFIFLLFLV